MFDALELILREGSGISPLKRRWLLKKLRANSLFAGGSHKPSSRAKLAHGVPKNLDLDAFYSLPEEWRWRIGCARLQLGYLDWCGWEYRKPRDGYVPKLPLWRGAPGKVLVYAEQGVGDEVMFLSALPHVLRYSGVEVTVEVDERLGGIVRRSFPGVEVITHPSHGKWDQMEIDPSPYEFGIPLGDLPALFYRRPFSLSPYLKPDTERTALFIPVVEEWKKANGIDEWVGISWKGRQGHLPEQWFRDHFPFSTSLQYTDHEWLKDDLEDLLSVISLMDRIVCVPTSIAHFAVAVGTPVTVVKTPNNGEVHNALNWRFGQNAKMWGLNVIDETSAVY